MSFWSSSRIDKLYKCKQIWEKLIYHKKNTFIGKVTKAQNNYP